MPGSGSPILRRRELGALLRALRTERGWTVDEVAKQMLCSPSKVSRLETGQRGASARDIRDLCDLYGVGEAERQQLTNLAAEAKQQGWWQDRGLPNPTYLGLQRGATSISDFGLGLVPGLLQTADYARAVLRSVRPMLTEDTVEHRLAGRMDQQQLLTSDKPPEFEAILDESVLHRVVGGRPVMRAQLAHLLTVSEQPRVTVRVLPYEAERSPVTPSKFVLLTFEEPMVPSVVFIEYLTGDLYLERVEDVEAYRDAFRAMRGFSTTPDEARGMISSIAAGFGD